MSLGTYFKRAFKYIAYDHKPKVIKAEIIQSDMKHCLTDKVVVITGGGKGLGKAIAKKLASEGAKVIITGRNEKELSQTTKEIGENSEYMVFDIKDFAKGKDIIDKIYEKYGKIDCLINNAGISLHEKSFFDVTEESFKNQMETNLYGSYFFTQHFLRKYLAIDQKGANIIFISSERGDYCDNIPYGLTKVAINSLVKGLSTEFYRKGVRVNGVAPGVTATEMTSIDKNGDLYSGKENCERYFVPEEVAETVLFLISDFSNCISGEIIHTNAGNHILTRFK